MAPTLIAIGLLAVGGIRLAMGRVSRVDPHFFFMGAAFMLIETWSISRASLIYGATWYVSSAVIASLLVAVLIANTWVELRGPTRSVVAFPLLLATIVLTTVIDPSSFLDLGRGLQQVLAAPLYAVPFLFASTIFASSLLRTEHGAADALSSNLLGAVLGGAAECLSYWLGLRALGFVACALYLLAWWAVPRARGG